eukprot:Colp12_sorted_trinity150504_noHs@5709
MMQHMPHLSFTAKSKGVLLVAWAVIVTLLIHFVVMPPKSFNAALELEQRLLGCNELEQAAANQPTLITSTDGNATQSTGDQASTESANQAEAVDWGAPKTEETSVNKKKPRIAIVSASYQNDAARPGSGGERVVKANVLKTLALPNKMAYACQHNYSLYVLTEPLFTEIGSWAKLPMLQRLLMADLADYILWTDLDALFMNRHKDVETLIEDIGNKDFAITVDPNGLNAGVLLIRNSKWSRAWLTRLFNWRPVSSTFRETQHYTDQGALITDLFFSEPVELMKHVALLPGRRMNAKPEGLGVRGSYQDGDFILHLPGEYCGYSNDSTWNVTTCSTSVNAWLSQSTVSQFCNISSSELNSSLSKSKDLTDLRTTCCSTEMLSQQKLDEHMVTRSWVESLPIVYNDAEPIQFGTAVDLLSPHKT